MTRRVRVLPDLYRALEAQLPAERGPHGEPTVAEFAGSDLLEIVDTFAELWDQLPTHIPGRLDYRELILTTRLVPHVVVRGQLSPADGSVEIYDIELDLTGLESAGTPDDAPDD